MKKQRANSVLTAFILIVAILILCSFGTDAAYVISSKNKLQKVTEAFAFEYASIKAHDMSVSEGGHLVEEDETLRDERREAVTTQYQKLYNIAGSGLTGFSVNSLEYKINNEEYEFNKEGNYEHSDDFINVAVKVRTTSRVMPFFLRFIGVRAITLHAMANAVSERVVPLDNEGKIPSIKEIANYIENFETLTELDIGSEDARKILRDVENYSPNGLGVIEFGPNGIKMPEITAKPYFCPNRDCGYVPDFEIEYNYLDLSGNKLPAVESILEGGGGYYIFAGDGENWTAIGEKIVIDGEPEYFDEYIRQSPHFILTKQIVCSDADVSGYPSIDDAHIAQACREAGGDLISLFCVNSTTRRTLQYSLLPSGNMSSGMTTRAQALKIYKAGNSGAVYNGEQLNPCSIDPLPNRLFEGLSDEEKKQAIKHLVEDYSRRPVQVKLTILNNIRLIPNKKYNEIGTSGSYTVIRAK